MAGFFVFLRICLLIKYSNSHFLDLMILFWSKNC